VTTKVRGDGEGSVYREGQWWRAAVSYRDPATGQRRQRRVKARTKAEAIAALEQLRGRARAGQPLRDSRVTVRAWADHWQATVLPASSRRPTTQTTYRALVAASVVPYLGGVPLEELRPSVVEGWLGTLQSRGLSDSTRRQALTVLRAMLDSAVRDGLLASNPTLSVARPTVRRTEAHSYTPAQLRLLVQAADGHRLRPLLIVLAGTGLRRGEALGLAWSHVDLERGELRVRQTLVRTEAGLVTQEPKTRNGWRTVPLSAPVVAALREQRRQQAEDRLRAGVSWIPTAYVFTTEAGTPLDPRNVSRWYAGLVAQTGVGGSVHTLRHTALTSMALAGVPLHVVSRIAGHESISTTADLYGHVTEEATRDALTRGAEALGL
jgi:integrase